MIDPGVDDPDDLRYDLEEDGRLVRRELDRACWRAGGWATLAIRYADLDPATEAWRPPRVAVLRLRKLRGRWRIHATVPLPGPVAHALGAALAGWFPTGGEGGSDGDDGDDGDG